MRPNHRDISLGLIASSAAERLGDNNTCGFLKYPSAEQQSPDAPHVELPTRVLRKVRSIIYKSRTFH